MNNFYTDLKAAGEVQRLRGLTEQKKRSDDSLTKMNKATVDGSMRLSGLRAVLKNKLETDLSWAKLSFLEKKEFFKKDIAQLLELDETISRRELECSKTYNLFDSLVKQGGLSDLSVYSNLSPKQFIQNYYLLEKYTTNKNFSPLIKSEILKYMESPTSHRSDALTSSDRELDIIFFNILSALLEESTFVINKKGLDEKLMHGECFDLIYSNLEKKLRDLMLFNKEIMDEDTINKILVSLSTCSLSSMSPLICSKALLVLFDVAEEMMPNILYLGGFNTKKIMLQTLISIQVNSLSDFKNLTITEGSLPINNVPIIEKSVNEEKDKKISFFSKWFGSNDAKDIPEITTTYTQKDLLLPTLMILLKYKKSELRDGWMGVNVIDKDKFSTADLRTYLKTILMMNEADMKQLKGRSDTVFDQIVRNLISNKVLEKSQYAESDHNPRNQSFKITDQGIQYVLEQFTDYLNTMNFSAGVKEKHNEMAVVPAVLFELFLAKNTEGLEMSELKKKVLDRLTLTQADQEILASCSDRKIDQVIRNLFSNNILERLGVADMNDDKWQLTSDGLIVLGKTIVGYLPLPDFIEPSNMKTTQPKFLKRAA